MAGKHLYHTTPSTSPSVSISTMTVSLVTGGSSTTTEMAEPVEAKPSTFQGISKKRTATSSDVPAYTDYNKSTPVLKKATEEGQSN